MVGKFVSFKKPTTLETVSCFSKGLRALPSSDGGASTEGMWRVNSCVLTCLREPLSTVPTVCTCTAAADVTGHRSRQRAWLWERALSAIADPQKKKQMQAWQVVCGNVLFNRCGMRSFKSLSY